MSAQWGKITPEEIVNPISGVIEFEAEPCAPGSSNNFIPGISTDSRNISPGMFFWALRGEQYNGHDFCRNAIEESAAGIVVEKEWWNKNSSAFIVGSRLHASNKRGLVVISVEDTLKALGDLAGWWRRNHNATVIGITGSAGKTTTKEMTANILEQRNKTLRNQGNFNNLIGLPLTMLQLDDEYRNAVLEMGMNHPGEIARLTKIADPDIGLITNVGMAHVEGLGNLEGILSAKWELVENMSPEARIILNGDDELLKKRAAASHKEIVTFGLDETNDVRAINITNLGVKGIRFDIDFHGKTSAVELSVPGIQNVSNALAASAVAICLDEPPAGIAEGLLRFTGINGRFMAIRLAEGIVLIDDTYNANPLSLKAAFNSIEEMLHKDAGRIIVGLGEMMELGDQTVTAHKKAGRSVAELNPFHFLAMGRHANEMIQGALEAGMPQNRMEIVKTHGEMIQSINDKMTEGDLIYLKGSRKIEMERVVEGLKSMTSRSEGVS